MPEPFRILNVEGRNRWKEFIGTLKLDPSLPTPKELLRNEDTSREILADHTLPSGPFDSKYAFAEALLPTIVAIEATRLAESDWPGVWDALALIYFEEICPGEKKNPKASERYVFTSDYRKTHRHRIYGPVALFQVGGEYGRLFLSGPMAKLSDQEEQIGSRQEMANNPELFRLMHRLYWDEKSGIPGRGWAPNSPKPGTLRRLVAVFGQFSRTFDLSAISHKAFIDLLPGEFRKWVL